MPSREAPATGLLGEIEAALDRHGLLLRGGFHPAAEDRVPAYEGTCEVAAVLMVGNAGPALWRQFARTRTAGPDPLDRWTRGALEPLALRLGAKVVFPFDKPPLPFQRWAQKAWPVHPSPLGLLIDPEHGLWHAYRGALLFQERLSLPPRPAAPPPCASCAAKPCLSACPVGAFDGKSYDVVACARHIAVPAGAQCSGEGCRAREACPVGRPARYPAGQIEFHMAAFKASVAPQVSPPKIPEGHADQPSVPFILSRGR